MNEGVHWHRVALNPPPQPVFETVGKDNLGFCVSSEDAGQRCRQGRHEY